MLINGFSADATFSNASIVSTANRNASRSGPRRNPSELTEEDQARVQELARIDREVRAHEQAHVTAGGQYVTGGPTYKYDLGPDGRIYAVAGEVSISTSPVRSDPEATIQKMRQVRAAALAPANPSAQDRTVAADTSAKEAQARQELTKKRQEELEIELDQSQSLRSAAQLYSESLTAPDPVSFLSLSA